VQVNLADPGARAAVWRGCAAILSLGAPPCSPPASARVFVHGSGPSCAWGSATTISSTTGQPHPPPHQHTSNPRTHRTRLSAVARALNRSLETSSQDVAPRVSSGHVHVHAVGPRLTVDSLPAASVQAHFLPVASVQAHVHGLSAGAVASTHKIFAICLLKDVHIRNMFRTARLA
jgi:hypothetical protein